MASYIPLFLTAGYLYLGRSRFWVAVVNSSFTPTEANRLIYQVSCCCFVLGSLASALPKCQRFPGEKGKNWESCRNTHRHPGTCIFYPFNLHGYNILGYTTTKGTATALRTSGSPPLESSLFYKRWTWHRNLTWVPQGAAPFSCTQPPNNWTSVWRHFSFENWNRRPVKWEPSAWAQHTTGGLYYRQIEDKLKWLKNLTI